ncbi:SpoIIE family protein phosphatase [candidate division WOR-3 bacterium]|nr:SpoIIE family protein phosphatase [candidate division WOR-3 bacterium]
MNTISTFKPKFSLKTKFLIWLILFIIGVMIVVYVYFSQHVTRVLAEEVKLRGETICKNLVSSAEDLLIMRDDLALAKLVYDTEQKNKGIVYCFVVDAENRIWAHTDLAMVNTLYETPKELHRLGSGSMLVQDYTTANGIPIFAIAMPIEVSATKIGEVHIGLSRASIQKAVAQSQIGIAVVASCILAVGIAGILLLVSFIIGSLGKITQDIAAIGNGDLDRPIETKRGDEIGRITSAVKTMAQKLKKAQAELIEKERIKREMQIAKEIQQSLLPRTLPQTKGFEIIGYYQAAQEVGGDYYDVVPIDDNRFAVVIGDVAGKGVAGSLVMAMVRSTIRAEAPSTPSPKSLITLAHRSLRQDIPEGMFMTIFCIVFDNSNDIIRYSCAGHNPAYFLRPQYDILHTLKPEGGPLGISFIEEDDYAAQLKEETHVFKTDDMLLLYTDGVTEAMNKQKEQFTESRLERIVRAPGATSPEKLKKMIVGSLQDFTGLAPQSDDITFVIVKRT